MQSANRSRFPLIVGAIALASVLAGCSSDGSSSNHDNDDHAGNPTVEAILARVGVVSTGAGLQCVASRLVDGDLVELGAVISDGRPVPAAIARRIERGARDCVSPPEGCPIATRLVESTMPAPCE